MTTKCPVCGKKFTILYPNLWAYKRYGQFICSWGCIRQHDRKEAEEMYTKKKKDGTPAKKPGPKKIETPEGNMTVIATKEPPKVPTVKLDGALRIETPEAGKVEVISKECIGVKPIENGLEFEYRVTGIDTAVGSFIYSKKQGYVDWDPIDGSGTVSMNLEEWKEFMKVFPGAMKVLGVKL